MGEREEKEKLHNITLVKGPSTKYDHFMRVCTNKNEENEKYFWLKILIITLIEHV